MKLNLSLFAWIVGPLLGITAQARTLPPNSGTSANPPVASATYEVPVDDEALKTAAQSVVEGAQLFGASPARKVAFRLPEDLMGPRTTLVTLTETAGTSTSSAGVTTAKFGGPGADATCAQSRESMRCKIHYFPVYMNGAGPAEMTALLGQKYASDPQLLQAKLQVMNRFQSDPEGILILNFAH